jgi:hypothetical protein
LSCLRGVRNNAAPASDDVAAVRGARGVMALDSDVCHRLVCRSVGSASLLEVLGLLAVCDGFGGEIGSPPASFRRRTTWLIDSCWLNNTTIARARHSGKYYAAVLACQSDMCCLCGASFDGGGWLSAYHVGQQFIRRNLFVDTTAE